MLGAVRRAHRHYRITMDYLARKQDELAKVVTHRWPLEKIAEAFGRSAPAPVSRWSSCHEACEV